MELGARQKLDSGGGASTSLRLSILLAVGLHALAAVAWPASETKSTPGAGPMSEPLPSPPPPKPPVSATSLEFVVLPAARPSSGAPPEGQAPAPTEIAARRQAGKRQPISVMKEEGDIVPKATPLGPAPESGFTPSSPGATGSLSMRMRARSAYEGRSGSLLDDAIAATPVPAGTSVARADLIVLADRIGLDSPTGRVTQWRDLAGGRKAIVGEPFEAHIESDGRIRFNDRDNVRAEVKRWHGMPVPMILGSFDVTDAAASAFGDVLYPYRKMKAMDQTRDMRAAMAVKAQSESLRSALARFERELLRLWRDTSLAPAKRRALLFALWDECAESGSEEVTKTARSIRAVIIAFIARNIPAKSVLAYSRTEIRSLNAGRSSVEKFAPYRL